jgi:hypothetical protein
MYSAHVFKDRPAGRRGLARRLSRLAQAVDVVHHDRITGIAAGLFECAPREGILVQQFANRVIPAGTRIIGPIPGFFFAASAQVVEQFVQGRSEPARLHFVIGDVQRRLASKSAAFEI